MIGSDSIPLYSGDGDRPGKPHPRGLRDVPARARREYAREQRLFPLETAVHKMTGMCAARLRLRDRGLVREGYAADLRDLRSAHRPRRVDLRRSPPLSQRAFPTSCVNGAVGRGRRPHRGSRPALGRVLAP